MSFGQRLRLIFEAKGNAALDAAEDPTEVLNLSYEQQLEQLQNLRRAIAQVTTEEKHVDLLEEQVQAQADRFTSQAQQALQLEREDLARQALQRKEALLAQVSGYKSQVEQLKAQEAHLATVEQQVETRIGQFRGQKELLSAQYQAAKASSGANEAVTGISTDMTEMNMAMQRAQDKVLHMQAHADAIDSLSLVRTRSLSLVRTRSQRNCNNSPPDRTWITNSTRCASNCKSAGLALHHKSKHQLHHNAKPIRRYYHDNTRYNVHLSDASRSAAEPTRRLSAVRHAPYPIRRTTTDAHVYLPNAS